MVIYIHLFYGDVLIYACSEHVAGLAHLLIIGPQINFVIPLQWRHDERDGVSDHQPHHCLLNRLFKYQSSASPAIVQKIHRSPMNPLHKWPVTRNVFPFDEVIMQRVSLPWNFSTMYIYVYQLIVDWWNYECYQVILWSNQVSVASMM